MMEYIAQMGPVVATASLLVAWVVQACRAADGRPLAIDMTIGLAGGVMAGVVGATTAIGHGMVAMFVTGMVGAGAALWAQGALWPVGSVEPVTVRS